LSLSLFIYCAVNILAARYYRLLEKERKIFLGLKGIDSLAAMEYLNLDSPVERAIFYKNYWQSKQEEQQEFEERAEYAFREFGRYAPLSDDRIPIYVKYGPPSKRSVITPQKKIGVKLKEAVKPAEVWKYTPEGIMFDFVRIAHAYKNISQSEFGEKVKIPYLKEVAKDSSIEIESETQLSFDVQVGRYRQKTNLTRLEVYISLEIKDTTDLIISRNIKIFNEKDSIVNETQDLLIPQEQEKGIFLDEVNFWLEPKNYRLEIELADTKKRVGKKSLWVDLIAYQNDAKEISDIIPAKLIDDDFTHAKFNKPVGRVIPLIKPILPVHRPFYLYTEVYCLETKNGMHQLRTVYEVYNKEKMKQEVVDIMTTDWMEPGDVAYLGAEYHPMDLEPGHYILILKTIDMISGKERTTVTEFQLEKSK